ncbi:uncharacterized protein [Oscarella lobularis]|uniref:uncharacterized protein isoform X2 n=1 Tax=Oscarella lobularis TaxID=121494 RepID=UPI003313462C
MARAAVLALLTTLVAASTATRCEFNVDEDEFSLENYPNIDGSQVRCWRRVKTRFGLFRGELIYSLTNSLSPAYEKFASPVDNRTGEYHHMIECRWIFTNDNLGRKFKLLFSTFDLEDSRNCAHDFVRVRYVHRRKCKIIDRGKRCGAEIDAISPKFYAAAVEVSFVSDETASGRGFVATLDRLGGIRFVIEVSGRQNENVMTGELFCSRVPGYDLDCLSDNPIYKIKQMTVTKMVRINETRMSIRVSANQLKKAIGMYNRFDGNCCVFDVYLAQSLDSDRPLPPLPPSPTKSTNASPLPIPTVPTTNRPRHHKLELQDPKSF